MNEEKEYTPSRLDYFAAAALTGVLSDPDMGCSSRECVTALDLARELMDLIDNV